MNTQANTLRRDLRILWIVIAAVSALLVWLLIELSRQGAAAQIEQARMQAALGCQGLQHGAAQVQIDADQHAQVPSVAAWQAVIDLALREMPGTEGGFWQQGKGVFAYAFPTYDGTGVKRDPPSAELARIVSTAELASSAHRLILEVRPGLREAMVFAACPLRNNGDAPVAWVLKRVLLIQAEVLNHLSLGLALITGFVVMSGIWLAWLIMRWQRQTAALMQQLAQSERMATLGRVSAGLAHEIRNPLATMRMKVENAMAAPAELRGQRVESAFHAVLAQSSRLETLVSSLLALTHPLHIHKQAMDIQAWLLGIAETHREAAQAAGIQLRLEVEDDTVALTRAQLLMDPEKMTQVMDNLILNALAHVPAQGEIRLGAAVMSGSSLHLWVADTGSGVPEGLRGHVFEPFSTARSGGTGLGLALAREIVQAHDGQLTLADTPQGARFEITLPFNPASQASSG